MAISAEENKTQGFSIQSNDKEPLSTSPQTKTNKSAPSIDEATLNKESIELIAVTHLNINKIKEDLDSIIDSINQNPSYITQASEFWGKLHIWQKIVSGLILTMPILLIGIFAHVAIATAISICMIITFVVNSLALDNHHSHREANDERLKKAIHGLTDFLVTIIEALELMKSKLSAQVELFAQSNEELKENINGLSDEINELHTQINNLQDTEKNLRGTQQRLEKTVEELEASSEKQSELFEQTIKELEQVKADYKKTELLLNEQIAKLSKLNEELNGELDKAKFIGTTLLNTVNELSKIVITEKENGEIFHKRLHDFLSDKEKSFTDFAAKISKEAEELTRIKDELQCALDVHASLNKRYEELLNQQDIQITRLSKLPSPDSVIIEIPEKTVAEQLSKFGIYAINMDASTKNKHSSITPPQITVM